MPPNTRMINQSAQGFHSFFFSSKISWISISPFSESSQIQSMLIDKARIEPIISWFVTVHPHETSALIHSTSSFFFVRFLWSWIVYDWFCCHVANFNLIMQILSAYFVVLPLRDEGAISLGLGNLPGLFVGSLLLTLVAAPVTTLIFSLPNLSKGKVWINELKMELVGLDSVYSIL